MKDIIISDDKSKFPVEQAIELFRAVLNECKHAGLDLNFSAETQIVDVIRENQEAILNIFSSENVLEAVKGCCDKVLYNKNHFSLSLFETEEARADFIGVMFIVGVENLTPFFPQVRLFFDPILSLFLRT